MGTSAPELAVSLSAALQGNADIAIANVVGSNIFNTFFILGLSALISPLIIHVTMIRREVPIMIGASIGVLLFSLDGRIHQIEALLLFAFAFLYTWWLVREAKRSRSAELKRQVSEELSYRAMPFREKWQIPLFIIVGLGVIMLGADWLVDGAIAMAKALGVSDTIIGLTIVAAGTSLPEVVASVVATIRGERDIAVGNVIGSNIYNIFLILGLSGSILPSGLAVQGSLLSLDIPVMVFSAVLCWPIFWWGKQIRRPEGALFLSLYVAYTTYLIYQA
jgi:cation:H+ antiporter